MRGAGLGSACPSFVASHTSLSPPSSFHPHQPTRAITLQRLMGVRMKALPGHALYTGGPSLYMVR
jgi:hypothetical protein